MVVVVLVPQQVELVRGLLQLPLPLLQICPQTTALHSQPTLRLGGKLETRGEVCFDRVVTAWTELKVEMTNMFELVNLHDG